MRVLFIGGTGNISTDVSQLALAQGIDLYHLNRGTTGLEIPGVHTLVADAHRPAEVDAALGTLTFDAVVNWIAYTVDDVEQDIARFGGKTSQYVFISSASVYQKPPAHPVITESTPLHNPYWQYARNKIACERRLDQAFRDDGFPSVIVRPSLTYATVFPVAIGGWKCYTLADRMLKGQPIIVHGDGASLWTVTDARDFAKGFVGLLGNPQTPGNAFHITSDEILTWNQIYEHDRRCPGCGGEHRAHCLGLHRKDTARHGGGLAGRQGVEHDFRQHQDQGLCARFSGYHTFP